MPVESIDEPFLKIIPTVKVIEFVRKNIRSKDCPNSIEQLKKKNTSDIYLRLDDIVWLKEFITKYNSNLESNKKVWLHELLEGVDIKLPTVKVTPRNPELEKRIQKLIAQQNNRDYEAMTKEIDPTRKFHPEDTIAYQMKQINKQLIAVAQFIFSVLAAFAFGFLGLELIFGSLDFGFRLLMGVICSLTVALAEIYFLAKKLSEEDYTDQEVSKEKPHMKPHQD